MKDKFNRTIEYMRVSVTDRCNLFCSYCRQEGDPVLPEEELLTKDEILAVTGATAELGIRFIKVTGGEPLLRPDLADIVRGIKAVPGIEKVTLTTNGVFLAEKLETLVEAGIDGVNISLDSMNRERYHQITGRDELPNVLRGLRAAVNSGITVRVNSVLAVIEDAEALFRLAQSEPIDVRFIERMPIGNAACVNNASSKDCGGISQESIMKLLRRCFKDIVPDDSVHGVGPAVYYMSPGFRGSIGFISAIHNNFCGSCSRIRLMPDGSIKPCLCFEDSVDLKELLRGENIKNNDLKEAVRKAVLSKPAGHCFAQPAGITEKRRMSSIGG